MDLFVEKILSWYDVHKRNLPWRNISDPYKIWVSEIILQQTRIVQGYDYYVRFIQAFPTIKDLARASEDDVLRQWQGLGYYSRARNMQKAAQTIVDEHEGVFPCSYEQVLALKGVGPYTAAAICSFAYNLPCAVIDGNVYRVLSRYFGVTEPIDSTKGKKLFMQLANELLPAKRSADYNQAIMDFGAMQCTPQSPLCEQCPLANACIAYNNQSVTALPVKCKSLKVTERYMTFVKIVTPEGVWLHKRQANDIWRGLYEFMLLEFDHAPSEFEVMGHDWFNQLKTSDHGTWRVIKKGFKHVLTHRVIYADLYELTFQHNVVPLANFIVVPLHGIEQYAMPQLLQKLMMHDK